MQNRKFFLWLKQGLFALTLMVGVLVLRMDWAAAAGFLPIPDASSFGDVPDPEGEGLQKAYNLVFNLAHDFRYIIGGVAILMMIVSGIKLVLSGNEEETANKQKTNLLWGMIGLVLIAIAGPIAEILDMQNGGFLSSEQEIAYRASLFDRQALIIITFIKYIVGSVAVLFLIRSGAKLVLAGDSDDVLNVEKKNIMTGVFALFLIMLSDVIVKQVLFKVDPNQSEYSMSGQEAVVSFDTGRGVQEIVGITNFIVTWASPFAVLALVIGGIMYLTAFGDDDQMGKAKKIIFNSIIALVIIYGAFALVSTFISGVF